MEGARRRSVDLNKYSISDMADASAYSKKMQGSTDVIFQQQLQQQQQQHYRLYPPWLQRTRDALQLLLMICILGALVHVACNTRPALNAATGSLGASKMIGGDGVGGDVKIPSAPHFASDSRAGQAASPESAGTLRATDETIHDLIVRVNEGKVKEMGLLEGDIIPPKANAIRSIVSDPSARWPASPDGLVRIPYAFSSYYSPENLAVFAQAFQDFQTKTCLRFLPRTSEASYVNFYNGGMCSGSIGYQQHTSTAVSIMPGSCTYKGVIIHETMHALGFVHEQSRTDRDAHVRILFANIMSGKEYNFQIMSTNNAVGPYDYNSVMHYSKYTYSSNMLPTIVPIPDDTVLIGQREGMSTLDVLKINNAYCGGIIPPGVTLTPPSAVTPCNATFSNVQGNFVSPGYPVAYANRLNCFYNFSAPVGLRIEVTFSIFMLEFGTALCPYDYVAAYNGPGLSSPQIGKYCGSKPSFTVTSSGNYMVIQLHTDGTQVYPGFMASYSRTLN
ncbi:astacin-like metalloendopeptidase [Petromyzon marinus]|uniref:astacin-like metalloendopeptidase n=1 Tax=Petromyzon marinus TaxID=7757 RepID=UPI003F6F7B48